MSLKHNLLGEVYLHFNRYNEAIAHFIREIEIIRENYESDAENLKHDKIIHRRTKLSKPFYSFMVKNRGLLNLLIILIIPVLIIAGIFIIIKNSLKIGKFTIYLIKKLKKSPSGKQDFDDLGAAVYSSLNYQDKNRWSGLLVKIKEKYMYIADLYYKTNDFENALKYYRLSMETKKRTGDEEMHEEENFLLNLGIGTTCLLTNRLDEAYNYCTTALKMHNEIVKIKNWREKKKNNQDDNHENAIDFTIFNLNVVKLHDTLGQVHSLRKNYKESLEHFNKAIETYNLFPPEDADSPEGNINIRNYHDLATLYSKTGKVYKDLSEPDKALMNYNKAFESLLYDMNEDNNRIDEIIREIIELLNNDTDGKLSHLDTIMLYYGANVICIKINRFSKSFEVKITIIDNTDEDLAKLHFFVGNVYTKLDKKLDAVEHFEKALNLNTKAIENCKKKSDTDEKHLDLLKDKLKIETNIFGSISIETAKTYYSIGLVYKSLGDNEKRLEYYKKGLEIRLKVQGEEHIDIATQYNNVAVVYNFIGESEKAIESHNKAISIRLKLLGEEHDDTAFSYVNIAYVYRDINEYQKALEYFEKALKIYKKTLRRIIKSK